MARLPKAKTRKWRWLGHVGRIPSSVHHSPSPDAERSCGGELWKGAKTAERKVIKTEAIILLAVPCDDLMCHMAQKALSECVKKGGIFFWFI